MNLKFTTYAEDFVQCGVDGYHYNVSDVVSLDSVLDRLEALGVDDDFAQKELAFDSASHIHSNNVEEFVSEVVAKWSDK